MGTGTDNDRVLLADGGGRNQEASQHRSNTGDKHLCIFVGYPVGDRTRMGMHQDREDSVALGTARALKTAWSI